MELPGEKAVPFLVFWGNAILFSTVAAPVCIPTNSALGFLFSTSLPALVVCWFVYDGHSDWCEMVSHWGFSLHLSDGYLYWASIHMSLGPPYVLLGKVSVQVLCPFFNLSHVLNSLPFILAWQGRYHDHEGGFPRARLIHCTPDVLTPAISPNVGTRLHNLW